MKKLLLTLILLVSLPTSAFAAIAFDAESVSGGGNSWTTNSSTISWTHTITGSNTILVVGVHTYNSTLITVSGITYNGVALTKIDSITANLEGFNEDTEQWYLVNPSTGSNTITVTLSGTSSFSSGSASSYTGVAQDASVIDSHATGQSLTGVTSFQVDTNVVASNSWLVGYVFSRDTSITAGANTTLRGLNTGSLGTAADSNATVGTGNQHLAYNFGASGTVPGLIITSLKVFTASPIVPSAPQPVINFDD